MHLLRRRLFDERAVGFFCRLPIAFLDRTPSVSGVVWARSALSGVHAESCLAPARDPVFLPSDDLCDHHPKRDVGPLMLNASAFGFVMLFFRPCGCCLCYAPVVTWIWGGGFPCGMA